jgi:hypothetical protein
MAGDRPANVSALCMEALETQFKECSFVFDGLQAL